MQAACGEAGIRAISFASIRADLINSTYKNTTEPKRRAENRNSGHNLNIEVGRLRQRTQNLATESKRERRRVRGSESGQTRERGVETGTGSGHSTGSAERSQRGQGERKKEPGSATQARSDRPKGSRREHEEARARRSTSVNRRRGEEGKEREAPKLKWEDPGRAQGRRGNRRAAQSQSRPTNQPWRMRRAPSEGTRGSGRQARTRSGRQTRRSRRYGAAEVQGSMYPEAVHLSTRGPGEGHGGASAIVTPQKQALDAAQGGRRRLESRSRGAPVPQRQCRAKYDERKGTSNQAGRAS